MVEVVDLLGESRTEELFQRWFGHQFITGSACVEKTGPLLWLLSGLDLEGTLSEVTGSSCEEDSMIS